jgi:hypothetical protein
MLYYSRIYHGEHGVHREKRGSQGKTNFYKCENIKTSGSS